MEVALLPHIDRLLTVLRNLVGDALLLHENREDSLIDRVVCTMGRRVSLSTNWDESD